MISSGTPGDQERGTGTLVEAEARKVCDRGHALGWRPWWAKRSRPVLGHCMCGARYRLETRGPEPLDVRAHNAAGDWVAITFPEIADRASEIARVAVRAYLNETEPRS